MPSGPPERITDAPLFVVPRMLDALRAWHAGPKLAGLPVDAPERSRLLAELDRLGRRLLDGIGAHPTRFWVMQQIRQTLEASDDEHARARRCFCQELKHLLTILGTDDVDGLIDFYLNKL
ncbi:hypothetical protein SAMN05428966_109119 [Massilia sp. PDC64]|nr:hypothetical protein [Massilia sp. PDC64]SDE57351.1 hypothetical protein SAMN05428966_109119 [Massilia sp. PDC64]